MAKCNFCNQEIPADTNICPKCGAKVKEDKSRLLLEFKEEQDVLN